MQTSATQVQAAKVKRLEAELAKGRGDADKLARERGLLGKMTRRLNVLTGDFQTAASQASRSVIHATMTPSRWPRLKYAVNLYVHWLALETVKQPA